MTRTVVDKAESRPAAGAEPTDGEILVRRAGPGTTSRQGLPVFEGLSSATAGTRAICMHLVRIPPGAAAKAHWHDGHETAIYVLKGQVRTLYGAGLRKSVVNGPGDFVYIPPGLPHKPINLSATEPAEAIVARTDPNEQESVVPYPEPGREGS